jgi:hypothetical protein
MRRRIHVSYEEEDTCVLYSKDTYLPCKVTTRIHVSYEEEEDTCVMMPLRTAWQNEEEDTCVL